MHVFVTIALSQLKTHSLKKSNIKRDDVISTATGC